MRNANVTGDFDFSRLDQAIGEKMGKALDDRLRALTGDLGHHYLCSSSVIGGEKKKVINLYNKHGAAYQVDSMIVSPDMQPLVVFESKYIRYEKYNRDEASRICTTHQALQSRYPSIRKLIAVLSGRWSAPSLAMMRNRNIVIFEVCFEAICDLLEGYNINFDWDEKDRNTAIHAYMTYEELPEAAKDEIGEQMIKDVIEPLAETVRNSLSPYSLEEIEKVFVELHSNLGAIREIEFDSVENAMGFLGHADSSVFDVSDTVKLTDPPS